MSDAVSLVFDEGYSVLSREFRTRTTSADIGELIDRTFGACAATVSPDAPVYAVEVRRTSDGERAKFTADGKTILNSIDPGTGFSSLVWHVMNDAVTGLQDLLVVHAGAVVTPGGTALFLPGASGSGKTTLTAALVREGFGFLSDEMGALSAETGLAVAVPRSLSIKAGSLEALGLDLPQISSSVSGLLDRGFPLRPDELRPESLAAGGPVRTIVAPTYRPGEPTVIEPVSRAQGLTILAQNAFNLQTFGGSRGIRFLREIVREATCYRLTTGTLGEAIEAIASVSAEERADL